MDQLGAMMRTDGVSDLLAGFNDAGQEHQVESWVGSTANLPTETGAVQRAVGRTRLEAMATRLGVSAEDTAAGLARIVPVAVDAVTPGGRLPTGAQLDELDLGELLSGIDVAALLR